VQDQLLELDFVTSREEVQISYETILKQYFFE